MPQSGASTKIIFMQFLNFEVFNKIINLKKESPFRGLGHYDTINRRHKSTRI